MSYLTPVLLLVGVVVILGLFAAAAAAISGDFRGFLHRFLNAESAVQPTDRIDTPRYRSRGVLLSDGERAFFPILESVLPDLAQHLGVPPLRAFVKVRLSDIIEPDCPAGRGSPRQTWLNKIDRKHTDAVLVDATTFELRCVVELDDKSHQTQKAAQRDATKNDALSAAGVPIARIPARATYDRRDVARRIAGAMKQA